MQLNATPPPKRTKLLAMVGVYERFYSSVAEISDPLIVKLCANWNAGKRIYIESPPGVSKAKLALGLEQGLRELPAFLASVALEHRAKVAHALNLAIEAEYPTFLATQQTRLDKIVDRGRIDNEREFLLIRHIADVAEAKRENANQLTKLYQLMDTFEARG
jgi:hypothetical protein